MTDTTNTMANKSTASPNLDTNNINNTTYHTNDNINKKKVCESLSEYLHHDFQTLLSPSIDANSKTQVIHRYRSFFSETTTNNTNNHSNDTTEQISSLLSSSDEIQEQQLHSVKLPSIYLTIHPTKPSNPKNHTITNSGNNNNNNIHPIYSGIQLPPFHFNTHFRKGYSTLLWIRLHPSDRIAFGNEPNILFRFLSPSAVGIQASLYPTPPINDDSTTATTTSNNNTVCNFLFKLETMGASPSTHHHLPTNLITPISLSYNTWTLVTIQHISPYLKRPYATIFINGTEICQSELMYPTHVLSERASPSSYTSSSSSFSSSSKMMQSYANHSNYSFNNTSNNINTSGCSEQDMVDNAICANFTSNAIDIAGFGLYREAIPAMVQSIIYEHGPDEFAEGVLPSVPPVVFSRDAVVMNSSTPTHSTSSSTTNGAISSSTSIATSTTSVSNSMGSTIPSSSIHDVTSNGPPILHHHHHHHNLHDTDTGRGLGTPLSVGFTSFSTSTPIDHSIKAPLLLQKLLSKLIIGWNASQSKIISGTGGGGISSSSHDYRVHIPLNIGCNLGYTAAEPNKIGIIQPTTSSALVINGVIIGPTPFTSGSSSSGGGSSNSGGSGGSLFSKKGSGVGPLSSNDILIARSIGRVELNHATMSFLEMETRRIQMEEEQILKHENEGDDDKNNINMSRRRLLPPSYQLPTSSIEVNPIPSFLHTFFSIDPCSYLLQPFHLALPPPGYAHNLQLEFYRDSFDHLYQLVVYKDGIYAASLIELLAAILQLGGKIREEVLQSGILHLLTMSLRRVLLRATRLGMLTSPSLVKSEKNNNINTSSSGDSENRLWEQYASRENPNDDLEDMNSHAFSTPPYIPPLITKACISIINTCCGPIVSQPSTTFTGGSKRRFIALLIRRSSDIALTSLFSLALDLDLWGGDYIAASQILKEVVNRYCCIESFQMTDNQGTKLNNERQNFANTNKNNMGHGAILRGQITVQYLIDVIRLRFGNESFVCGKNNNSSSKPSFKSQALSSIASSLSQILYSMLKFSLSSKAYIYCCESDISAVVAALSDCPLGSVGAHAILTALKDILIYCEVMCIVDNEIIPSPLSHDKGILSLLMADTNSNATRLRNEKQVSQGVARIAEQNLKMKDLKTEMARRLHRYLILGQFHDVIAPMLLSRTVFDARRAMMENNNSQRTIPLEDQQQNDVDETNDRKFEWQHHWRIVLIIYTWLASISGPDGEISAKSTGSLLFHSGKAGSLHGCLLNRTPDEANFFVSLLIPSLPSPTSAVLGVSRNHTQSIIGHTTELSHRLRIMMHLLGGLISSLVSQLYVDPDRKGTKNDIMIKKGEETLLGESTIETLVDLVNIVAYVARYLHSKMGDVGPTSRNQKSMNSVNLMVKAAKEAVPPLLIAATLLDKSIQDFRDVIGSNGVFVPNRKSTLNVDTKKACTSNLNRNRTDSDMSWVEVTPSKSDFGKTGLSNSNDDSNNVGSLESRLYRLTSCQDVLLQLAGTYIFNAMIFGGGEASTIVWRSVVTALSTFDTDHRVDVEIGAKEVGEELCSESLEKSTKNDRVISEMSTLSHKPYSSTILSRLVAMVLMNVVVRGQMFHDRPLGSIELCSATARLCDLVEEKSLLHNADVDTHSTNGKPMLTVDQVRLLCALLKLLHVGRDHTGWCQLVLPSPPMSAGVSTPSESAINFSNAVMNEISIAVPSPVTSKLNKFVDEGLMAENYELYYQVNERERFFSSPQSSNIASSSGHQTNSHSISTSKLLLPILQPCLRVILGCLGRIRSKAKIVVANTNTEQEVENDEDIESQKSLLSITIEELRSTLTDAIVGLAFSNARDVCLNSLSCLRKSISKHLDQGDDKAATNCQSLFVTVVGEMRVRYSDERKKRELAQLRAYDRDDMSQQSQPSLAYKSKSNRGVEAANSSEVERLLMGNALIDGHESKHSKRDEINQIGSLNDVVKCDEQDDFILFPLENGGEQCGLSAMGWSGYRGFGSALEKCHESAEMSLPPPSTVGDDAISLQATQAIQCLEILALYLDSWDQRQVQDEAESEFIELFDENSIRGPSSAHVSYTVTGSETAADCMSSYIEISSAENSRLLEMQSSLFPSRRFNCLSFHEKNSWKHYFELIDDEHSYEPNMFERSISDGGRDYAGRVVTVPVHPQFARSIPRSLDHSLDFSEKCAEVNLGDVGQGDLNALLGNSLTIVDITKKQGNEDHEELLQEGSIDESENIMLSSETFEEQCLDQEKDDDDKEPGEDTFLDFPTKNDHEGEAVYEESSLVEARSREETSFVPGQDTQNNYRFSLSSFASPPDGMSSLLGQAMPEFGEGYFSAGGGHGFVELYYDNCLHVKAEGSRKGTLLLTATHMIFEYEEASGLLDGEVSIIEEKRKKMMEPQSPSDPNGAISNHEKFEKNQKRTAALRPKSIRWSIHELSYVYLRRFRLRDSALEMFFVPSGGSATGGAGISSGLSSVFLDFGPGNEGNETRDAVAIAIIKRSQRQTEKQHPERSGQFLREQLKSYMIDWVKGRISNFDYLLALNCLAGRSFNDLCQYPVMPWVLSNYTSEEIPNLNDPSNFRDLTKPMGALNPKRLEEFVERFETFQDNSIPPFMYGSHYSTSAGVVLHFLVRLHPFASLHRQLQGGHFDVADRLFSSVSRTWEMCTGMSAAEVKELTPEWYFNPAFLRNSNNLKLGSSQDGEVLGDVVLPPWAKGSPEKFVEVLRCALESDICTAMLPDWIDLIFGRKQQGPESVKANNVFFYLTYYGSVDVASIEDDDLRAATELQIAHFGQCPMQLFYHPHPRKLKRYDPRRRESLSSMLQVFDLEKNLLSYKNGMDSSGRQLPFLSAPLSYWVHLDAPPPGPHAPLIAVRLAGTDRCLAIDAQGIFHFFRWQWKAEIVSESDQNASDEEQEEKEPDLFSDKGCFIAQRELPHFRSVPRLCYSPPNLTGKKWSDRDKIAVVAISKSMFKNHSYLLAISDGDGKGALCIQVVSPKEGVIKGHVIIPAVHSARITAIHMDPIGIAAGTGGFGGELAIVGSADGTASVWRLINSQYMPLRPRLRFGGHQGARISAVAINSSLSVCVTVSAHRCCIFSLNSGVMIRSFGPPSNDVVGLPVVENVITKFGDTNGICVCSSGHIVLTCESTLTADDGSTREIVSLHLYTLEGVHVGSKALESWRGIPHKMIATSDGHAVIVCSGRGVSFHLISALTPLHFVDEWQLTKNDDLGDLSSMTQAYDIDFGPSLARRSVVSVAACSSGALRLHALKGISEWSEENKKGELSEKVNDALSKPAQTLKSVFGSVKGTGFRVVGFGREIGGEAMSDIKAKGVGGFLGDVVFRKK